MKNKLIRGIFPVVMCLALILMVNPVTVVRAASDPVKLDYEDYVENMKVTDDGRTFYVSLPTDYAYFSLYDSSWSTSFGSKSSPATFTMTQDYLYSLRCDVFGSSDTSLGAYLSLDNIPNGTSVSVSWSIDENLTAYDTPNLIIQLYYIDSDYSVIKNTSQAFGTSFTGLATENTCTFDLSIPDDAIGCWFRIMFYRFSNIGATKAITWSFTYFDLVIPVEEYYYMLQQFSQQTELLDKIEEQLEEQGQTLEDILTGSSDQQAAADDFAASGDDQTGRLDSAVSDLQDIDRPDVDDIDVSISTLLGDFGIDGFNEILALIWENELIYQLMIMASLVMLASYILYGKKV